MFLVIQFRRVGCNVAMFNIIISCGQRENIFSEFARCVRRNGFVWKAAILFSFGTIFFVQSFDQCRNAIGRAVSLSWCQY